MLPECSSISEESEIVPGDQRVFVISALSGGVAEKVLRAMAETDRLVRNIRVFDGWVTTSEGVLEAEGAVRLERGGPGNNHRTIKLVLGRAEELFLKDVPGRSFSLKPISQGSGLITIPIGDRLPASRILGAAQNIVAVWVTHGFGWLSRPGKAGERKSFDMPFGAVSIVSRKRGKRKRRNDRLMRMWA